MRSHQVLLLAAIMGMPLGGNIAPAIAHPLATIAAADDGGYHDWLEQALGDLSGDDQNAQNKAADQLELAVVYPPVRDKVLAALEPHLASTDTQFRLRCVKAYGHWATAAQVRQLMEVVATPANPGNMSGNESSWAAAVVALISIDPRAARQATDRRLGVFFFRDALSQMLNTVTEQDAPGQPVACELQRRLDTAGLAHPMSVAQAEAALRSDSASERTTAANDLAHAPIDNSQRAAVLALLKPHLMGGSNGRARLPFVLAFTHWATPADVPTLQAMIAYPRTPQPNSGHEDCWAAATVALVRFDPQAALAAMQNRDSAAAGRSQSFFYRTMLERSLSQLAASRSFAAPNAAWLLNQISQTDRGLSAPPLPPGFHPSTAVPAAPAAEGVPADRV